MKQELLYPNRFPHASTVAGLFSFASCVSKLELRMGGFQCPRLSGLLWPKKRLEIRLKPRPAEVVEVDSDVEDMAPMREEERPAPKMTAAKHRPPQPPTRPVEDELRKQVADLMAMNAALMEKFAGMNGPPATPHDTRATLFTPSPSPAPTESAAVQTGAVQLQPADPEPAATLPAAALPAAALPAAALPAAALPAAALPAAALPAAVPRAAPTLPPPAAPAAVQVAVPNAEEAVEEEEGKVLEAESTMAETFDLEHKDPDMVELLKWFALQELTPHALYMRLKRLCSYTDSGKLQVPDELHKQWIGGNREELMLAMVKALKLHGFDSSAKVRKLVRVGGFTRHGFSACRRNSKSK